DRVAPDGGLDPVLDDRLDVHRSPSLSDPFGLPEDALRSDQQDDDEDEQRADVLELGRHHQGGQLHEHAHDAAAPQGAVGGAEATQRHAGEHQQQQPEAHQEADLLGQAQQDAAQRRQAGAAGPHESDDPVDVDARRLGQGAVVGHGPHGLAHAGALQEQGHPHEHDDREHDREDVAGHDRDRPDLEPPGLQRVLPVGAAEPAELVQEDVAQQDAEADRHDQHGDEPGAPAFERSPEAAVEPDAEQHPAPDGQRGGHEHVQAQRHVEQVGHQRPEGDELAVGEVREPGGAVDQRQPHRADGDDQPVADALDGEPGRLVEQVVGAGAGGL